MFKKLNSNLSKLLNKVLRKEEISREDNIIYLHRWVIAKFDNGFWLWKLLRIDGIRIYLHKFTSEDHSSCAHDHPCSALSFIFINGYVEKYWDNKLGQYNVKIYKAPCIRFFPATHTHKVSLLNNKPGWSLILMMKNRRPWGFWTTNHEDGKRRWWSAKEYREKFNNVAGCED